jgi:hypothetical protein
MDGGRALRPPLLPEKIQYNRGEKSLPYCKFLVATGQRHKLIIGAWNEMISTRPAYRKTGTGGLLIVELVFELRQILSLYLLA